MTKPTEHTRVLNVEGAYNVRDLGGYETCDGRTTRWGRYLRADTLANVTPGGVETLLEYGVRNIIDLRRSSDLQFRPSPFIGNESVTYYHQNMSGDVGLAHREVLDGIEDQAERRGRSYCSILDQRKHILHQIFSLLAMPDGPPSPRPLQRGQGQGRHHCRLRARHLRRSPRDHRRGLRPHRPGISFAATMPRIPT